ncbi:MAG: carbohydrate binding family 9 domain-containing protein [Bacteroidales bacterium]|nr:carbohydrate binding family 9 domain-containing protein [Bacteroidales bacterium]
MVIGALIRRIFLLLALLFFLASFDVSADRKDMKYKSLLIQKTISAVKADQPPLIDGVLDDPIWMKAEIADNFIQYSPYSGSPSKYRTEVRILYDDDAVYIGAMMYDPSPDSIYKELGARDSDHQLNADQFTVDISPYNDGVNGATFKVSVSGVQSDRQPRLDSEGYDRRGDTWDAVWESNTSINENGWIAEIKIPYSALRFPAQDVQTWGINFWREVRRNREQSSWNYVDRKVGSSFNHLGEITNIRDVKPPLRLSFNPYISAYLEQEPGQQGVGFTYNGGLDLKYGINESFTLDATLVPDFGQVQSDDRVLNLSPYEVRYNEKRPFFMEGTELFNKGGVFYSRRVGSIPKGYYEAYENLGPDESVVYNPQESALINATKISGRTKSGLGIGIFNAISNSMTAIVENAETGERRQLMTDPLTNYNMLVLDQSLKNNSYFSLFNTNVWRNAENDENFYTANVSGTEFKLQDKGRQYSLSGQAVLSQKYYRQEENDFGHAFKLSGGKTGGIFRLEYELDASSLTYDHNDMGYMRRNNEFQNQLSLSYNIFQPFWKILNARNSFSYQYNMLYEPRVFTGSEFNLSSFVTFINHLTVFLRAEYKPRGEDDYYEPRISGWYYRRGRELSANAWISTDRSKSLSGNIRFSYNKIWSPYDQYQYSFSVRPTLKLTDRFSLEYDIEFRNRLNDIGYVDYVADPETIVFGLRNNSTLENTFQSGFIFSANSYLSLRLRHYWSRADYQGEYFTLNRDGSLSGSDSDNNYDYNYNAWNIDLVYTWRFAPGSEMSIVWKNSIYSGSSQIYYDFRENLGHMFDTEMSNSFSLKILYYLDWMYFQKRK